MYFVVIIHHDNFLNPKISFLFRIKNTGAEYLIKVRFNGALSELLAEQAWVLAFAYIEVDY